FPGRWGGLREHSPRASQQLPTSFTFLGRCQAPMRGHCATTLPVLTRRFTTCRGYGTPKCMSAASCRKGASRRAAGTPLWRGLPLRPRGGRPQAGQRPFERPVGAECEAARPGVQLQRAELYLLVAVPAAGAHDGATQRRFAAFQRETIARRVVRTG